MSQVNNFVSEEIGLNKTLNRACALGSVLVNIVGRGTDEVGRKYMVKQRAGHVPGYNKE